MELHISRRYRQENMEYGKGWQFMLLVDLFKYSLNSGCLYFTYMV